MITCILFQLFLSVRYDTFCCQSNRIREVNSIITRVPINIKNTFMLIVHLLSRKDSYNPGSNIFLSQIQSTSGLCEIHAGQVWAGSGPTLLAVWEVSLKSDAIFQACAAWLMVFFWTQEGEAVGGGILQLPITDRDTPQNGPPFSFYIVSGNEDRSFHIDQGGLLSVSSPLRRRDKPQHLLKSRWKISFIHFSYEYSACLQHMLVLKLKRWFTQKWKTVILYSSSCCIRKHREKMLGRFV